jgi:hypothetical protein
MNYRSTEKARTVVKNQAVEKKTDSLSKERLKIQSLS